jgi:uncharacterized protein (TIGR02391 family)
MTYRGFEYEADEIMEMSVADIALAILQNAHESDEWNPQNWMGRAKQGYSNQPAVKRLAEGWQWLFSKGAVARDYSKTSSGAMFITTLGESLLTEGTARLVAEERLGVDLHPLLHKKVRRLFLLGEYDFAVFAAFREVEIRVRDLIGAPESRIGIPLMREAFGLGGRLRATGEDEGELDATAHLFAGAIGVFKNPTSHREVDFDDPIQAAESVLFADLLLRLLDRIAEDASAREQ